MTVYGHVSSFRSHEGISYLSNCFYLTGAKYRLVEFLFSRIVNYGHVLNSLTMTYLTTSFKIISPLMSVGLHITPPAKWVIISLFIFVFKKFAFLKYPTRKFVTSLVCTFSSYSVQFNLVTANFKLWSPSARIPCILWVDHILVFQNKIYGFTYWITYVCV
jgi:hypothetical protein